MKISVKRTYSGTDIIIKAENVDICESISSSVYDKKEDGKPDYKKFLRNDIDDAIMRQFSSVMEDITYYREEPYDTSSLIEVLFEKLPNEVRQNILNKLNEDYLEDEE